MQISTIKTAVQSFCSTASGLGGNKCVFAYQGGTEPTGNYLTLIPIMGVQRRALFDEQIQNPDGSTTIAHRRALSVQIDAYGPNAAQVISSVFDGVHIPSTYKAFSDLGLCAMFSSAIRDISSIKNIRYEQRYSADLLIECVYSTEILADDIGWFDSIRFKDNILGTPEIIITGD